jgi:hypothetical protein
LVVNLRNTLKREKSSLAGSLLESLEYYFFGNDHLNILSEKCLIYCLLDPRLKNLDFLPIDHQESVKKAWELLSEELESIPSEVASTEVSEPKNSYYHLYGIPSVKLGTDRQQKLKYYGMPPIDITQNPLVWWRQNEGLYPKHARLALKYLSRPATSVPCERVWSEAGNIISTKRATLDPDTAAMLIYLEHNLRELQRLGEPYKPKKE